MVPAVSGCNIAQHPQHGALWDACQVMSEHIMWWLWWSSATGCSICMRQHVRPVSLSVFALYVPVPPSVTAMAELVLHGPAHPLATPFSPPS